jgi:hypothetical protein
VVKLGCRRSSRNLIHSLGIAAFDPKGQGRSISR